MRDTSAGTKDKDKKDYEEPDKESKEHEMAPKNFIHG